MNNISKTKKLYLSMLCNKEGKLRNGWWMVIFVVLVAMTRPVYGPLKEFILQTGATPLIVEYLAPALILLVTWLCLRLRGEPLSRVGLVLNKRWLGYFAAGIVFTALQIIAITVLIYVTDGLSVSLNPERNIQLLTSGVYLMLSGVIMEELLFRGFLFQRLLDGTGVWFTQLSLALLFAFSHWGNPGMDGITQVIASVDLALGALILGLAYIRTGSLALPIGLHLGWNYFQGPVLGFSVSGYDSASWFIPVLSNGPVWLNGGTFGLEASIFSPIVNLLFLIALWRWKGITTKSDNDATLQVDVAVTTR